MLRCWQTECRLVCLWAFVLCNLNISHEDGQHSRWEVWMVGLWYASFNLSKPRICWSLPDKSGAAYFVLFQLKCADSLSVLPVNWWRTNEVVQSKWKPWSLTWLCHSKPVFATFKWQGRLISCPNTQVTRKIKAKILLSHLQNFPCG